MSVLYIMELYLYKYMCKVELRPCLTQSINLLTYHVLQPRVNHRVNQFTN